MYKKIFMGIAAAAALTLVSCSSEDLNSVSDNSSKNEAISFDGYLGRSAVAVNGSRGSELTKTALQGLTEGFGVFGNYKNAEGLEFGSNWFDNVQVKYSSKDTKWTYSPVQYWLPQGHIDFLAYAPYDSKYNNQVTEDNQKLDFTVDPDIKKQKDLLWANATNQIKANKPVTFTFKHALSRLGYTVKTSTAAAEGTTITLNKITLAGSDDGTKEAFYSAGTIDLSKTSSTDLWNTSSFDKQNFTWFSGNQKLTDKVDNNTEYLFVIPQNFSKTTENADALYVIVEYTIKYEDEKTMTNKVSSQLKLNFEQGKAYTLNLTLGLTPIEFDVTAVEGWTDTNQGEINSWN